MRLGSMQGLKTLVNHAHKLGSQHRWNPLKGFKQGNNMVWLAMPAAATFGIKFQSGDFRRIIPTLYILKYADYDLWL